MVAVRALSVFDVVWALCSDLMDGGTGRTIPSRCGIANSTTSGVTSFREYECVLCLMAAAFGEAK